MSQSLYGTTPHDRLRRARVSAGYETAADFAAAAGIKMVTYQHHENGRRELRPEVARLYARLLNLSPGTLLYGEQLPTIEAVSIVATVGKHGQICTLCGQDDNRQTTVLPHPVGLVGTRIVGDDLYPVYRNGDVVFHRELSRDRFSLVSLNGLECVVELDDGTQLLRQLIAQGDGKATLLRNAPTPEPAEVDRVVVAAAPVEFVQRRMPAHLSNR
jgi:transcriptional regulator with XRE-family HTH domain